METMRRVRWGVRVLSALFAVFTMYAYSTLKHPPSSSHMRTNIMDTNNLDSQYHDYDPAVLHNSTHTTPSSDTHWNASLVGRHLLSSSEGSGGTDDDDDKCTRPRSHHSGYNDSCHFVLQQCRNEKQLINYLAFVLCDLKHVQPLAYILLGIWLVYLISLLATTADYFFVPPLNLLATKLKLSPSIAGITLLAIGNGAPDVFTAYAALKKDEGGQEMALVLGALIGASIFISTVVLGTIILLVKVTSESIDKLDYVRDVTAYMIVVVMVVGVSYDGTVHLYEAIAFPIFYIVYIAVVVALSYLRRSMAERRKKKRAFLSETSSLLEHDITTDTDKDSIVQEITASISISTEGESKKDKERLVLLGLTWPQGSHIGVKIQWLVEWPFSLLRWLSIPPCYYDGQWSEWHHWFAVTSPIPMALVLLVAAQGWNGFSDIYLGKLPLFGFLVIIGASLSVVLFFILRPDRPPHWLLQSILGLAAFVMSIAWLNIEANETVSLLETFGLLFSIDSAILGLTVLAIGNSVGDWVADTAVARAGFPGMGVASCFGSPLLNDVIGLSVALIARIGIYDSGKTYVFPIHSSEFSKVKMSWIFLGISLVASAIVFPLFKFNPPKVYGVALIYLYVVFMVFSLLDEVGVLKVNLP